MAKTQQPKSKGYVSPNGVPEVVEAVPGRRKRGRGVKILLGVVVVVLVLVVAGVAFAYYLIHSPLPTVTGAVTLPGLSAPVTIVRDKTGMPHITAANSADLFRAQGYVVAQDRLWQMDFYRRVGAGRLSEVLGPTPLDTDRFVRTVGWRRAAQRNSTHCPPTTRRCYRIMPTA